MESELMQGEVLGLIQAEVQVTEPDSMWEEVKWQLLVMQWFMDPLHLTSRSTVAHLRSQMQFEVQQLQATQLLRQPKTGQHLKK